MSRIYLSPPDVGAKERANLLDAFDSNWIAPLGPHVDGFEEELSTACGRAHTAALSSGTAGLHLALRIVGVEAGDHVITSTLTFAATANAIMYRGAKPVFVDSRADHWCMDEERLKEALLSLEKQGTPAKAVLPVDLYGQCPNYEALLAICEEHGVPLIEDSAESLGSKLNGAPAGSFGRMAVLSFNGNKIITTSGGGALMSNLESDITTARFLATQARDPAPHYQHSTIGYNYRLSNILAALGRAQLSNLDEKVSRRRAHREAYADALKSWDFLTDRPGMYSNAWLTVATINPEKAGTTREKVRLALGEADIEARPVWKPLHMQPVFEGVQCFGGAVSEALFENGICLPSGSSLTDEQRSRVIDICQNN